MTRPTTTARVDWRAVAVFYALACAVSWPFYWWRDMHGESFWALPVPSFVKTSLYMAGPAVAAVVVMFVLRRRARDARITLFGHAPRWSVTLLVATLAIWTGLAYPHMTRLDVLRVSCIAAVTYVLGEEYGWRGYLQDALRALRPLHRYILIGVMWEAWHFTNRLFGEPLEVAVRLSISYPAVILLSAAIGFAVERSRSVFVAVAIHLSVNVALETAALGSVPQGMVGLGASIALWLLMLRRWPRGHSD